MKRLFQLKTPLLALILAIVILGIHLGIGFLLPIIVKKPALAIFGRNSLKVYWPAYGLLRIFPLSLGYATPTTAIIVMIMAAWFQWWIIFAVGIWLTRLYFRKPPVSKKAKMAIVFATLIAVVGFYEGIPGTLGMSKYESFRIDVATGKIEQVKETLKHNPDYANRVQPGMGTALHEAANMNQLEIAKILLDNGSDVNNGSGSWGFTPLHWAAWNGYTELAKVLIAHGANVNAGDQDWKTPLFCAAGGGHTNTVVLLLANGANVNANDKYGNNPLLFAIENNRYGIVPLLLSNGAELTGEDFDRAALQDSPELIGMLLPYLNGTNFQNFLSQSFSSAFTYDHPDVAIPIAIAALRFESNSIYEAAFNGNAAGVQTRLESEPDSLSTPDLLGLPPLHWAVAGGQDTVVKLLLAKGADIRATDKNGNTPLIWAIMAGQSNIVATLISNKVGLNTTSANGMSPLLLAVQQKSMPIAEMLLKAGANPNIAISGGETPLCLAVMDENAGFAKLLQAHGADFNVRCYGDTLFHFWAKGSANLEVARLLLAQGCDINAKGEEGKTPLHDLVTSACRQKADPSQLQAIQWLLDHKADVNAKDDRGATPLSLLHRRYTGGETDIRKDIGDLLRKYGAKK